MVTLLSKFLGSPLFYLFSFEEQRVAMWNVTAMNSFLSLVASISSRPTTPPQHLVHMGLHNSDLAVQNLLLLLV
jgi:hypothetical protein